MIAWRFVITTSFLFGAFSLFAVAYAVPIAISHSGEFTADITRFFGLLLSAAIGLAFLYATKTLRIIRNAAIRYDTVPLRFALALAFAPPALCAMLSGGFPHWLTIPLVLAYLAAFVLPGLVFQGLTIPPFEEIKSGELGVLTGQKLRENPKARQRYIVAVAILFMIICAPIFGSQSIPTPLWSTSAGWLAFAAALLLTFEVLYPMYSATPKRLRARSTPTYILFFVFVLAVATIGFRTTFRDAMPVGLGLMAGKEVTENYRILEIDPDENRKLCYASVNIETPAGPLELCTLPGDFVRTLEPGDILEITGTATAFGQTIKTTRKQ